MDGRKISHERLQDIRLSAIEEYSHGIPPQTIAEKLGLSRSCVYRWVKNYKHGGQPALIAKPLFGRPSLLEKNEVENLYEAIFTHKSDTPTLWTQKTISRKITEMYGKKLSKPTISRLLNQIGIVSKKKHYRFNSKIKPAIKQKIGKTLKSFSTKRPDLIFESMYLDSYFIQQENKSLKGYVYSFISSKGAEYFCVLTQKIDFQIFIQLINQLISLQPKNVILIFFVSHSEIVSRLKAAFVSNPNRIHFLPLNVNEDPFKLFLKVPIIS